MPTERRLAAIMFTDIVGYTALMAESEAKGLRARARHRELVRPLVEKYHGESIEARGDESLSVFPTALDAVSCALAIEDELHTSTDLKLHIGIHLGDVVVREGEVSGDGVNIASRICALSEDGGLCVSGEVYQSVRNQPDMEAVPLGEHELKNVGRPVAVYALGRPGAVSVAAPPTTRSVGPQRYVIGAALVVVGLATFAWWGWNRTSMTAGPIRSLAVLPLANLSGDAAQEYFADGMTEALISELAKIKTIKVISRTSAMRYKGTERPLTEIAGELGVDALVEGSVYKGGEEVRITAQLIHGGTDEHLWSESYTGPLENVLQLQADVALAIASEIRATLTPEEKRRLASARSLNPEAHAALLKGRHLYNRFTARDVELAGRYFRKALELDAGYAEAYAWLSITHWLPVLWGLNRPDFAVAASLANEALRLDPESAAAHTSIGWIASLRDRDWKKAERSFRLAIELDPSLADAHLALSDLLGIVFGRSDEAIQAATEALERDPLAPLHASQLGFLHMIARDFDAAVERFESVLEFAPDFAVGLASDYAYLYSHLGRHERALQIARRAVADSGTPSSRALLALFLARAGRLEEARQSLAQALEEGEEGYLAPSFAAAAHASLGNEDEAFRWLRRGVEEKGYFVLVIKHHPMYDSLREDPRFDDLLQRIGFPES